MNATKWILPVVISLAGCNDAGSLHTDDGGAPRTLRPQPMNCPAHTDDVSQCQPLSTDYQPRASMPSHATWPACISDDDIYHLVGMTSPDGAARARAWDMMGTLLWSNPYVPLPADFLAARDAYSVPTGIAFSVETRQDIHYPEIPNNTYTKCSEPGIPEMYPDRCVGPAKLAPLINDAFEKGIAGTDPVVQTARLEAALVWLFYVTTLSELWACTFDALPACDGFWGHYCGGVQRGDHSSSMARYVYGVSPPTADRVFDGILAARCWRDIDPALPAIRTDLYQLSLDQADRAELRGVALVLRERFGRLTCTTGDEQRAQMEFVRVLGGFIDHAARTVDASKADALKAQWSAASAGQVDIQAAQSALDALFPCP
jgi:hypothetical protein